MYLSERGYTILSRNARTTYGEIDLVAHQEGVTVFVEVKTRTSNTFGPPETSITPQKQAHILDAAQAYLQEYPEHDSDWRIEVVDGECLHPDYPPKITHFENMLIERG